MKCIFKVPAVFVCAMALCSLAACGAGGKEEDPTYSVGGQISGLAGHELRMTVRFRRPGEFESSVLVTKSDGSFTFDRRVPSGFEYDVTVDMPNSDPAIHFYCQASHNFGTITDSNITNVLIR